MAAHAGYHTSVNQRGDLLARPDVIGHTVSLGCLLWHYDELHFGPEPRPRTLPVRSGRGIVGLELTPSAEAHGLAALLSALGK